MESYYVVLADIELLASSNFPTSASQSAEISVNHCAKPHSYILYLHTQVRWAGLRALCILVHLEQTQRPALPLRCPRVTTRDLFEQLNPGLSNPGTMTSPECHAAPQKETVTAPLLNAHSPPSFLEKRAAVMSRPNASQALLWACSGNFPLKSSRHSRASATYLSSKRQRARRKCAFSTQREHPVLRAATLRPGTSNSAHVGAGRKQSCFNGVACVRMSGCDEGAGTVWKPNYCLQGAPLSSWGEPDQRPARSQRVTAPTASRSRCCSQTMAHQLACLSGQSRRMPDGAEMAVGPALSIPSPGPDWGVCEGLCMSACLLVLQAEGLEALMVSKDEGGHSPLALHVCCCSVSIKHGIVRGPLHSLAVKLNGLGPLLAGKSLIGLLFDTLQGLEGWTRQLTLPDVSPTLRQPEAIAMKVQAVGHTIGHTVGGHLAILDFWQEIENSITLGGRGGKIALPQEFETSLGNIERPHLYKKILKVARRGGIKDNAKKSTKQQQTPTAPDGETVLPIHRYPQRVMEAFSCFKMKLNISFPAPGCQKLIEVDDECTLHTFYETCMATEVAADALGEEWKSYVVQISEDDGCQYVVKKPLNKEGKKSRSKASKIQCLVTPHILQHKRQHIALKKQYTKKNKE
ncbi:40S ribosomal protein S6 [Plecturocebus cupreus]